MIKQKFKKNAAEEKYEKRSNRKEVQKAGD